MVKREGTCARDCAIKYPTHASPCARRQSLGELGGGRGVDE
jgi:hypothetical protein